MRLFLPLRALARNKSAEKAVAVRNRLLLDGRVWRPAFSLWDAVRRPGLRRGLVVLLIVGAPLLLPAAQFSGSDGQGGASNPGVPNGPASPHGLDGGRDREGPSGSPQQQEQMAEHRNSERQKQLVADTEKLFQLAQQLRDEVAKSNKDQLAVPVVKKSEEIEKLARSVKEKMRGY